MKELPPPSIFGGQIKQLVKLTKLTLKFKFYILRTTPPPPDWNFEDCQICVGFFVGFFLSACQNLG